MKNYIRYFIYLAVLSVGSAGNAYSSTYAVLCGSIFSSYPDKFKQQWIEATADWYAVIPQISEREKKWLDQQLRSPNDEVRSRAFQSEEYLLDSAHYSFNNLAYVLRDEVELLDADKFLHLLYFLEEYQANGAVSLQRLFDGGIVSYPKAPDSMESRFIYYVLTPDPPYFDGLRDLRQHIIRCLIPKILNAQR
jgi:hypothetical protein